MVNEAEPKPEKESQKVVREEVTRKDDPGLLESHGSFPVWLLKLIHNFTPDSLITKNPPKKDYRI